MIMHECIYCDHFSMIPFVIGAWEKIKCEQCGKIQWLRHSNIDPETYSEDMVDVDESTKIIKIKKDQLRKIRMTKSYRENIHKQKEGK